MKIAVTGKGGCGKTTVAGTLARLLAEAGHEVIAVDCDPSPNLGRTIGLSEAALAKLTPVLNGLLASGYTHHDPRPAAAELVERFGLPGGERITLVATGRIERPSGDCLCCGSHTSTRSLFGELAAEGRFVIADLEAGLSDLIWAKPGREDALLVVADPSAKAVEIARRATVLAAAMGISRVLGVANRAGAGDAVRLAAAIGAEAVGVPADPAVEAADRAGVAPLDRDPRSPAMVVLAALARRIEASWPAAAPVT